LKYYQIKIQYFTFDLVIALQTANRGKAGTICRYTYRKKSSGIHWRYVVYTQCTIG